MTNPRPLHPWLNLLGIILLRWAIMVFLPHPLNIIYTIALGLWIAYAVWRRMRVVHRPLLRAIDEWAAFPLDDDRYKFLIAEREAFDADHDVNEQWRTLLPWWWVITLRRKYGIEKVGALVGTVLWPVSPVSSMSSMGVKEEQ